MKIQNETFLALQQYGFLPTALPCHNENGILTGFLTAWSTCIGRITVTIDNELLSRPDAEDILYLEINNAFKTLKQPVAISAVTEKK